MKYNRIASFINILIFFYIILYKYFSIYSFYLPIFSFQIYQITFLLMLFNIIVYVLIHIFRNIYSKNNIIINIILIIFIMIINLYLFPFGTNINANIINITFFPLSFMFGLATPLNSLNKKLLGFLSILCLTIISIIYIQFSLDFNYYVSGQLSLSVNSIYYVLFTLPFLKLLKSKIVIIFYTLTSIFLFFYSNKATPLIGIFLFIFILTFLSIDKKQRMILLYFSPLVIFIFGYIFYYEQEFILINKIYAYIFGESERIQFINNFIHYLSRVNLTNLLIGNGYNSAVSTFGITFHNDYIELIYSFGLIGLFLYLLLFFRLYKKARNLFIKSLIIVFLFLMLSTHLLLVPTYSGLFAFLIGVNYEYN